MKSVLIKDTTKSERIAIIKEWIPVDDGLEDCEIDMWEMYREYINGEKEIAQINEEFSKRMFGQGSLLKNVLVFDNIQVAQPIEYGQQDRVNDGELHLTEGFFFSQKKSSPLLVVIRKNPTNKKV